jgi:hypothetical protein
VGSYPTLSPITCAGDRASGPVFQPSAGLLSAALDVTGGLRRPAPRVLGPSGLSGPGLLRPLPSRVRTFLYARIDRAQRRVGRPEPWPLLYPRSSVTRPVRRSTPAAAADDNDLRGAQADLDLADSAPVALPTRVVRDGRIEPCPRNSLGAPVGFYDALVGLVVDGLGQRGSRVLAVDSVAGSEGLYRRRAGPEGACDPVITPALVHPTLHIVHEFPERNPLVNTHSRITSDPLLSIVHQGTFSMN